MLVCLFVVLGKVKDLLQMSIGDKNRSLLHTGMLLFGLSSKLIIAIIILSFFLVRKVKAPILLFIKSLHYYLNTPFKKSWKSSRLYDNK